MLNLYRQWKTRRRVEQIRAMYMTQVNNPKILNEGSIYPLTEISWDEFQSRFIKDYYTRKRTGYPMCKAIDELGMVHFWPKYRIQ